MLLRNNFYDPLKQLSSYNYALRLSKFPKNKPQTRALTSPLNNLIVNFDTGTHTHTPDYEFRLPMTCCGRGAVVFSRECAQVKLQTWKTDVFAYIPHYLYIYIIYLWVCVGRWKENNNSIAETPNTKARGNARVSAPLLQSFFHSIHVFDPTPARI